MVGGGDLRLGFGEREARRGAGGGGGRAGERGVGREPPSQGGELGRWCGGGDGGLEVSAKGRKAGTVLVIFFTNPVEASNLFLTIPVIKLQKLRLLK